LVLKRYIEQLFTRINDLNPRTIVFLALLTLNAVSSGCDGSVSSGPGAIVPSDSSIEPEVITQLSARHRSGQTFIVWLETSPTARYNVYRHNQPITEDNLDDSTLLNRRWGSLGPDTSLNRYATPSVPSNFVVDDLSAPLSNDTALFVYTIPNGEQAQSYYAFTSIVDGQEDTGIVPGENTLTAPVQETAGTPTPVLTASTNDGRGRIYTQYMDYTNWNPTLNGYAYSYAVALPFNYDPSIAYPLQLNLHAFGDGYRFLPETEHQWEFIQVSPSDPGQAQNTIHTWWYGFSADHNYETEGDIPSTGTIENFTEQRILAAVRDVMNDSELNVNSELVHVVGNSMGASGALALGLRYPDVFSGIYASEPMTNYAISPTFQNNFARVWGEQSSNLPIVNDGPDSGSIRNYDANGNTPASVWEWMNHLEQVKQRSSDQFAFLMIDHGKADTTIDWTTQGQPLVRALTDAKVGFSANAYEGVGHTWLGFGAVVHSMFGLGFGEEASWRYPNSLSFPAISNASGSSSLDPGTNGDSSYNTNIEWSTSNNTFDTGITDTTNQYQISIRSIDNDQTASVTPRNTRFFRANPSQQCNWYVIRNSNGQSVQSGNATADAAGLITIDGVTIVTGTGSRLTINC
jgi:pimeloyl-ACP methyl ester carboxylesterase